MTNKPMLSVEMRALLERLLSHDFAEECQECGIGCSDAWGELRALLDKEVDMDSDASKHQGDPVAGHCTHPQGCKSCSWCGFKAEQTAPVADHTQCEECKGWGYHENHHEGGGAECGECGGSGNAAVTAALAVVMPERKPSGKWVDDGSGNGSSEWHDDPDANGYNSALDDVARLNGVKT